MSKTRTIGVSTGRTAEEFDTYGHNQPKEDGMYPWEPSYEPPVPHEDIDTDALRKQTNRERNSSYRKG